MCACSKPLRNPPEANRGFRVYRKQRYSENATAVVAGLDGAPLFISESVEFEFKASLRLQVFRFEKGDKDGCDDREAKEAKECFDADIGAGTVKILPCDWSKALVYATIIAEQDVREIGARSMDILHVASACQLQCNHFATFDSKLRLLSQRWGLTLLPAELPPQPSLP
jgi:hypothetical protein